jgi:hypothetical protein
MQQAVDAIRCLWQQESTLYVFSAKAKNFFEVAEKSF